MESPLPPDPYVALGVSKDVDTAAIKSIYRKLVLKCHPDKFTDETVKAQKVEEFHKIQQAYEILSDEEKRSRYDAQIRLCELRREALEKQSSGGNRSGGGVRVEIRTTNYEVRTAAPSSATFTSRGPTRAHAERKPSRSYDEHDRFYEEARPSSRKESSHDYVRKSTKDRDREKKEQDRSRAERKKEQSKNKRRDHNAKFASVEDDDSEAHIRQRSELEEQRRRNEEAEKSRYERERYAAEVEEKRRKSDDERRRAPGPSPRKEKEFADDVQPKYHYQYDTARDYINSSKREHDMRRSNDRPIEVRRSSAARPKASRNYSSSGRERGDRRGSYPEIVEFPPTLRPSDSSPANLRLPRSNTYQPEQNPHIRVAGLSPPPPSFRRSATMPTPQDSSHRKEGVPSSKLRQSEKSEANRDSGYSSPDTPEAQYSAPQHIPVAKPPGVTSTRSYVYSAGAGGVTLAPDNAYHTVIREPERERRLRSSPSPIRARDRDRERDRAHHVSPSVNVVPPTPISTARYNSFSDATVTPDSRRSAGAARPQMPGLNRAATALASPTESGDRRASLDDHRDSRRGTTRPLFGELNGVSYSQHRRNPGREFDIPGMERGRPTLRTRETAC